MHMEGGADVIMLTELFPFIYLFNDEGDRNAHSRESGFAWGTCRGMKAFGLSFRCIINFLHHFGVCLMQGEVEEG